MFSRLFVSALLVPALFTPVSAPESRATTPVPETAPAVWNIDPAHSGVSFQIRHFVSRVRGNFAGVKGTITASSDAWQDAVIDVQIATASISTANERRDGHLKSNDFFAADSFPVITFKSTRVERSGDEARIHGNLTMRGVTRAVVLDGRFTGLMKEGRNERVGFEATTTVNRVDYGVKWNRAAEAGGAMLGDDVKVEITVEALRTGA